MSEHHAEEHHFSLEDNIVVFINLICLTITTVALADFDLGWFTVPAAMIVALIKATVVAVYFMHLKFDNNINRFIFLSGYGFLFLLWIFCAVDIYTR